MAVEDEVSRGQEDTAVVVAAPEGEQAGATDIDVPGEGGVAAGGLGLADGGGVEDQVGVGLIESELDLCGVGQVEG